MQMQSEKAALIILDGFGITPEKEGNAILMAKIPYIRKLFSSYPKALLKASGQEAGLPWGEVGNSEVGHTNIGLGRIVLQDLPQIDKAISEKKLQEKQTVKDAIAQIQEKKSNLHIIGLLSDGAIHCHINHLSALIEVFKVVGCKIFLHLIADGRDVPEKSIEKYVDTISKQLNENVAIASLSGRYFAMDRDKNWDRIQSAYDAILQNGKFKESDIANGIKSAYARGETDEFISPTTIENNDVPNLGNDIFIFANYRSDRAIQLTRAFVDNSLSEVNKKGVASNFITMTTYDDNLGTKVLFSNLDLNDQTTNPLTNPLPQIIAEGDLSQYHIAETEKYAHVTYFFAGGVKDPYKNQENKLFDSAKVKSHDLYPQMRAAEITKETIVNLDKNYNLIVMNYANCDMVGHSGNLEGAIKTVEVIDFCLGKLIPALIESGYSIVLTSDHGNCDEMINLKSKKPNKEHTLNPVPLLLIKKDNAGGYSSFDELFSSEPIGVLADIAPTILPCLSIQAATEMTGMDLLNSLS